jgi:ribosome assembly protein YihI (activator of Der GTPase)
MAKDYKANVEAHLDDLENQVNVIKRLNDRNNLTKKELDERLNNLLEELDRVKFYLTL